MAETKTRSLLRPVVAGVVLLVALVLIVAYRAQIGDLIASSSREGGSSLVSWVPDHKGETVIIIAAFLLYLAIDWAAHIAGRLKAWLFVVVVQIGLWFLFWNSFGIEPLKDLIGLQERQLSTVAQVVSLAIIMVLSGIVFWSLEAKESLGARRKRTGGGD